MALDGKFTDPFESQNKQERMRAAEMLRLFDAGAAEAPDIIGYHGTSTEALTVMLKTGNLPGLTHEEGASLSHTKGDLFIAPILKNIPSAWFRQQIDESNIPTREDVEAHAESIARRHYVLSRLGIPLNDDIALNAVIDFHDYGEEAVRADAPMLPEEAKKFIQSVGIDRFAGLMKEAESRKGVFLTIKKSALDKHGFGIGDPGSDVMPVEDAKLRTGSTGLSLDDIGGMSTSGEDGKEFIERLRKLVGQ
jgi:hypothetical protein